MRASPKSLHTVVLALLAVCAACASAMAASGPFEQGVQLTRDGRFAQALDQFLAARAAGDDSALLQFNLGVVYYRLGRLIDAREAFDRAATDPAAGDLARYSLGLVALAAGDAAEAARWFEHTARAASQPELRALAQAALDREAPVRTRRGLLVALRGIDSNVVVPVGANVDVPSSIKDRYSELRSGWVDQLDGIIDGLGYHFNGVLVAYDEVRGADLAVVQAGLDWHGPVTLGVNTGLLAVDDSGYQRSYELRLLATPYDGERLRAGFELSTARLDAMDRRARDLDGQLHSGGLVFDGQVGRLTWNLSGRRSLNDRAARALSPIQDTLALRLRLAVDGGSLRAWARYVSSDYRTARQDEVTEFGVGMGWVLNADWDLLLEASEQTYRSSAPGFAFDAVRFYGGLRWRI